MKIKVCIYNIMQHAFQDENRAQMQFKMKALQKKLLFVNHQPCRTNGVGVKANPINSQVF